MVPKPPKRAELPPDPRKYASEPRRLDAVEGPSKGAGGSPVVVEGVSALLVVAAVVLVADLVLGAAAWPAVRVALSGRRTPEAVWRRARNARLLEPEPHQPSRPPAQAVDNSSVTFGLFDRLRSVSVMSPTLRAPRAFAM